MSQGRLPPAIVEDYRDLELCRMYHCTPSELDREDAGRVLRHWAIDQAIERWRGMEADSAARRAKGK
jgi:hypothetical protein